MEIYMGNDVVYGELKINESFIREIIKLTLEEIHSNKYSIYADNIVKNGEQLNICKNNDISDTKNKQLDSYHKEITRYVVNRIEKLDLNIDIGDENMCFRELIIAIVDKLVQLTNSLRENIEENNKNHDAEINSRDSKIESITKALIGKENELNEALEEKNL